MATLAEKIECEERMRKLLEDNGMPQPDGVEYGYTCVRFFFEDAKACVVVDIDNSDEDTTMEELAAAEIVAAAEEENIGYREAVGDLLSDDYRHN